MELTKELVKMDARIKSMKEDAIELDRLSDKFPAISRNTARILASLKMLELNLSDIVDI
ncbi:MAG: hypothetical protein JRJ06_05295 [Deltaproteobacteria bacterium]|nr:hypothetical protein [Deltaproteobacteria bacterium]